MARTRRVGTASSPEGPAEAHGLDRGEAEEARQRLDDDGPTWLAFSLRWSRGEARWRRLLGPIQSDAE